MDSGQPPAYLLTYPLQLARFSISASNMYKSLYRSVPNCDNTNRCSPKNHTIHKAADA